MEQVIYKRCVELAFRIEKYDGNAEESSRLWWNYEGSNWLALVRLSWAAWKRGVL